MNKCVLKVEFIPFLSNSCSQVSMSAVVKLQGLWKLHKVCCIDLDLTEDFNNPALRRPGFNQATPSTMMLICCHSSIFLQLLVCLPFIIHYCVTTYFRSTISCKLLHQLLSSTQTMKYKTSSVFNIEQ